jgi:rhodanese-related sulfurtransferase
MNKFLILLLSLSMVFFFGCSEDDDVDEFKELVSHLEDTDADYQGWVNNLSGWVVTYASVENDLTDYLILDLRSSTDFAASPGPITGAVNTSLADILDAVEGESGKILTVCYTGQTSAYAHMLLRMKGYEAYSLKWGMSGVYAELDKWTAKCSDEYYGTSNWVTTASPTLPEFDYPELDTGKDDAADILDERIEAALNAWGTQKITAETVMADPSAYNIICYWPESAYTGMGHINGAYRVEPKTLTRDGNLSVFDPDSDDNVLYCYTGQTSAATVAYLYVLGYDVKTLVFGANSMIHDHMTGGKWPGWGK